MSRGWWERLDEEEEPAGLRAWAWRGLVAAGLGNIVLAARGLRVGFGNRFQFQPASN